MRYNADCDHNSAPRTTSPVTKYSTRTSLRLRGHLESFCLIKYGHYQIRPIDWSMVLIAGSFRYWINSWSVSKDVGPEEDNCRVATRDISLENGVLGKMISPPSSSYHKYNPFPFCSRIWYCLFSVPSNVPFTVHSNSECTEDSVVHRHSIVYMQLKCPYAFNCQIRERTVADRLILYFSSWEPHNVQPTAHQPQPHMIVT